MRGEGLFQIHIHVVGVVVGFEADVAAGREQILEVELADEGILLRRVVLVAEVAVEDKAVVQELAGEQHLNLRVLDAVLAGTDVGAQLNLVGEAIHDVGDLRREGGRGNRAEVVRFVGVDGVVGRVELVQDEQVDNLTGHHVFCVDQTFYLPLQLFVGAGQFEVK